MAVDENFGVEVLAGTCWRYVSEKEAEGQGE
jgi:hypothetical protein